MALTLESSWPLSTGKAARYSRTTCLVCISWETLPYITVFKVILTFVLKKNLFSFLLNMYLYMPTVVQSTWVQCLQGPEEGIRPTWAGVGGGSWQLKSSARVYALNWWVISPTLLWPFKEWPNQSAQQGKSARELMKTLRSFFRYFHVPTNLLL